MAIEARIEEAFEDTSARLFWADSFVEEGFGNLDEVLAALRQLVDESRLSFVLEVYSPDGHRCWEGPPDLFREDFRRLPFRCADLDCEHIFMNQEELQAYLVVRFEITQVWEQKLSRTKKKRRVSLAS